MSTSPMASPMGSPMASRRSPTTPKSPGSNRWVDIMDEVVGFGMKPEVDVPAEQFVSAASSPGGKLLLSRAVEEAQKDNADDENTGEGESSQTSSKDNSSTADGAEEEHLTIEACGGMSGGMTSKDVLEPSLYSMGSKNHDAGRCKPCAFFHTKGCNSGVDCQFCHRCPAFEKQRRKRVWRRPYNGAQWDSSESLWDRGYKSNNHSRQGSGASIASTSVPQSSWVNGRGLGQHSHSRQTSTASTLSSETGFSPASCVSMHQQGGAMGGQVGMWPPMPYGLMPTATGPSPMAMLAGAAGEQSLTARKVPQALGEESSVPCADILLAQAGLDFCSNFDGSSVTPTVGQQVMCNGVQYTLVPVSMAMPPNQQMPAGYCHQQGPYPTMGGVQGFDPSGGSGMISPCGMSGGPSMGGGMYSPAQQWY